MPATICGYGELERWSRGLGDIHAFGIEGTGSYGAGIARFLTGRGYTVVAVNRPDRSTRYRKGKSDPTDAEMAARSVLAGVADATPKSGQGEVEMIRMLKSARHSALKARTQTINQMKALVVTAPSELRESFNVLSASALATRCQRFRPDPLINPIAPAKYTLRSLACRYRQISEEVRDLEAQLTRLTRTASPTLIGIFGVGPDTAATLLVTAGSNPERLHSEAAFAALCGVCPIPASSGKTNRHRLNRGGDRQANAALHRIVVVRLRHDQRTKSYMRRRTGDGMSKIEVIRCLKRYVAREVFTVLLAEPGRNGRRRALTSIGASLNQKELARLSVLHTVLEYQVPIAQAAELLGVSPRHARRMLAAYRTEGAAAVAHGNRDRRPHNAIPPAQAAAVVQLAAQRYEGANHTHFTELLQEREGIDLSRPTVRRILTKAGIGSPAVGAHRSTVSGDSGCPRPGCWCSWTAAFTPGLASRAHTSPCSWRWTTPPASWPTRCSVPWRTPEATSS